MSGPGWGVWRDDDGESCIGWTAEQHIEAAEQTLDSNVVQWVSESALGNEDGSGSSPPNRHYASWDGKDAPEDPPELAPFLAALTHAMLAVAKRIGDTRGE